MASAAGRSRCGLNSREYGPHSTLGRTYIRGMKRGEIIGTRGGAQPTDEAEHFIKGWIDMRDVGQVLEHEGPLPHPAQDRPN
jgi:hypothetical protein